MSPLIACSIACFITLLAQTYYAVFKIQKLRLSYLAAGIAFVPIPIWVGSSIQQVLYSGDIVGSIWLVRSILRSLQRQSMVADRPIDLIDQAAFFLLVISPSLANSISLIANDGELSFYLVSAWFRSTICFIFFKNIRDVMHRPEASFASLFAVATVALTATLIFGALHYIGVLDTDIVSWFNPQQTVTTWTDGYGGGIVGLYRGDFGGYTALLATLCTPGLLRRKNGGVFSALIFAGCIILCLAVGSRQGLAMLLLGAICNTLLSLTSRDFSVTAPRLLLMIMGAVFAGLLALNSETALSDWMRERFLGERDDNIVTFENVILRDERMPYIVEKIVSNISYYILGVGTSPFSEHTEINPNIRIYVDSELLWLIQQNGLLALAIYIILFCAAVYASVQRIRLMASFFPAREISSIANSHAVFSSIVVSLALIYGHYVLMNFDSSHIAIAYMHWMILALAFIAPIPIRR